MGSPAVTESAPTVRERPILFSAPMVRALLDGRKTVTRRVLKPQPADIEFWLGGQPSNSREGHPVMRDATGKGWSACGPFTCPYGPPGSRLWVRETFGVLTGAGRRVVYRADGEPEQSFYPGEPIPGMKWTPSIHMPRWASRLTLEVVSVRAERLHDITEEDAVREGVERWSIGDGWQEYGLSDAELLTQGPPMPTARESFRTLWESINGPESWDANPWVWAISFRKVEVVRG
ncbi:hypothetical protein [Corallococcus sp. 4LFB]|uniref:hypothetical protein n=1 Tax=Corallococcus sp. 4LFB TaxID=3383249 RepID=UPI003974C84B